LCFVNVLFCFNWFVVTFLCFYVLLWMICYFSISFVNVLLCFMCFVNFLLFLFHCCVDFLFFFVVYIYVMILFPKQLLVVGVLALVRFRYLSVPF